MAGRPTVALAIVVHDRPEELRAALASTAALGFDEVVVVDNGSEPPVAPAPGCAWRRSDLNLGVAGARNLLVASSSSDVVFFLDDDAIVRSPDLVGRLRRRFAARAELGAVACRIERPGGEVAPSEWPYRGRPDPSRAAGPAAYFVGAGHAVRRTAWERCGGLDERFVYSTEEIDLSMSLLREGWEIVYEPAMVVEHRPSDRGRAVAPAVPAFRMRNRIVYARRHLPVPALLPHLAVWALRTGLEARRADGLGGWLRAVPEGFRAPVERRPLSWRRLLQIHRAGGRVFW